MKDRKSDSDNIFEQVAAKYGVPVEEVVRDMQEALDDAWDNSDPAARARQRQLFPKGKPSIEEFVRVMAKQVDK